jgi:hypothetical protein
VKKPWSRLEGYPQLIVVCVCVLLVSGGLCGVQLAFADPIYNGKGFLPILLILLGMVEWLAMGAAALVLAFCLVLWPIEALFLRGKQEKRPTKLFGEDGDTEKDEETRS